MELLMSSRDSDSQPVMTFVVFVVMVLMIVSMISGCATAVPVTAKFPAAPGQSYLEACPDLQKLKDQPQLSDISKTIGVNYGTYYECAVKLDTWIRWYAEQKIIFEKAGK